MYFTYFCHKYIFITKWMTKWKNSKISCNRVNYKLIEQLEDDKNLYKI